MPRLQLFPFRYRNPVTGKWVRARYVASREEIAKGNVEWEIIDPPEFRDVDLDARYFTPFRVAPHAGAMRMRTRQSASHRLQRRNARTATGDGSQLIFHEKLGRPGLSDQQTRAQLGAWAASRRQRGNTRP